MMARAHALTELPPIPLPRIGYSRAEAAEIVGVGVDLFDRAVEAGALPLPRMIGSRLVWDITELVAAFRELPHKGASQGRADAQSFADDDMV